MTDKAIISLRKTPRIEAVLIEKREAEKLGLNIVSSLSNGTLISGEKRNIEKLEKQGFRVITLKNSNLLITSSYEIDIEKEPPKVPKSLEVPKNLEKTWIHNLIQLAGPPNTEWIKILNEKGIKIVDKISRYGLYVLCSPEELNLLKELPFVTWTGPFKPAYRISPALQKIQGDLKDIRVTIHSNSDVDFIINEMKKGDATNIRIEYLKVDYEKYQGIIIDIPADNLHAIACLPDVRYIDYQPKSMLTDERCCQIVAGDLDGNPPPNTAPNLGYGNTLADLDLDGSGVTIAIVDSGVCTHDNATMNPDLADRITFFEDKTGGNITTDENGHGTHVAGIALGNGDTGDVDPQGFVLGLGVAPGADFGSINAIAGGVPVDFEDWVDDSITNNANIMNNSWGALHWEWDPVNAVWIRVPHINYGYTELCRTIDRMIREPEPNTVTLEKLCVVFAAGNEGPNLNTILEPGEAKNVILVGSSLNFRPGELAAYDDLDDIRGLSTFSSRGPAADDRILPTVIAPGSNIISTRPNVDTDPGTPGMQRPRDAYQDTVGTVHNDHYNNQGTSMAAPHVSGLCALLVEWWRDRTDDRDPSQAMLKALLINGAIDCADGPCRRNDPAGNPLDIDPIPNEDQGWGRVCLENIVLQSPDSDRGPKIFVDQRHAFTTNLQTHKIKVAPVDTNRAMRITLVWSDTPGDIDQNPAIVNDLNLEVEELSTNTVYLGNQFANGFSIPGGNADTDNNVECVYIENPTGDYEISIIPQNITHNALPPFTTTNPWQDFALVIDNAEYASGNPVCIVPVIDRSGSMTTYGYVDVTKTSSKQFIDLMSPDDEVGLVSFGNSGDVEYPTDLSNTPTTVTDSTILENVKDEVDNIDFTQNECTYMGDGIGKARDLLNNSPANLDKAMVLLSDGYDNRGAKPSGGCDSGNPAKPSAYEVASNLDDIPVYTCAMGPNSDQELLEDIAEETDGKYYYMPTIDDLFEIYNYIRGQVTGTGVIVNDSATASWSRLGGWVDCGASKVTFTVAWADDSILYVDYKPKKETEISIRLRDPNNNLLHPNCTYVRRKVGDGYIVFSIDEPIPGRWYVEVETAEDKHVRYTVGGFVDSPLRMIISPPKKISLGKPFEAEVKVFDGRLPVTTMKAVAKVTAPSHEISTLLRRYKTQLEEIQLGDRTKTDMVPEQLEKLVILRNQLIAKGKPDIFEHSVETVHAIPKRTFEVQPSIIRDPAAVVRQPRYSVRGLRERASTREYTTRASLSTAIASIRRELDELTEIFSREHVMKVPVTPRRVGSLNLNVSVSGISPATDCRFERKDLLSLVIRQD